MAMRLGLVLILALWGEGQGDWPAASGLTRPAGAAVAVWFVDPADAAAGAGLAELEAWLADWPAESAHVVVAAGAGPLPPGLGRRLLRLPRTTVHFPQDRREAQLFGVTAPVVGLAFDAWGRRRTRCAFGAGEEPGQPRGVVWSRV